MVVNRDKEVAMLSDTHLTQKEREREREKLHYTWYAPLRWVGNFFFWKSSKNVFLFFLPLKFL